MPKYTYFLNPVTIFLIAICSLCLISMKGAEATIGQTDQDQPDSRPLGLDDGSLDTGGIRMFVSLLVVLALIAVCVFLLRKVMPYRGLAVNGKHPMQVLSRVPLGQKRSICLVKVADEVLVIGLTNTNISLLSKMNADDYYDGQDVEINETSTEYRQSFRKILDKIGIRERRASTAHEEGL